VKQLLDQGGVPSIVVRNNSCAVEVLRSLRVCSPHCDLPFTSVPLLSCSSSSDALLLQQVDTGLGAGSRRLDGHCKGARGGGAAKACAREWAGVARSPSGRRAALREMWAAAAAHAAALGHEQLVSAHAYTHMYRRVHTRAHGDSLERGCRPVGFQLWVCSPIIPGDVLRLLRCWRVRRRFSGAAPSAPSPQPSPLRKGPLGAPPSSPCPCSRGGSAAARRRWVAGAPPSERRHRRRRRRRRRRRHCRLFRCPRRRWRLGLQA